MSGRLFSGKVLPNSTATLYTVPAGKKTAYSMLISGVNGSEFEANVCYKNTQISTGLVDDTNASVVERPDASNFRKTNQYFDTANENQKEKITLDYSTGKYILRSEDRTQIWSSSTGWVTAPVGDYFLIAASTYTSSGSAPLFDYDNIVYRYDTSGRDVYIMNQNTLTETGGIFANVAPAESSVTVGDYTVVFLPSDAMFISRYYSSGTALALYYSSDMSPISSNSTTNATQADGYKSTGYSGTWNFYGGNLFFTGNGGTGYRFFHYGFSENTYATTYADSISDTTIYFSTTTKPSTDSTDNVRSFLFSTTEGAITSGSSTDTTMYITAVTASTSNSTITPSAIPTTGINSSYISNNTFPALREKVEESNYITSMTKSSTDNFYYLITNNGVIYKSDSTSLTSISSWSPVENFSFNVTATPAVNTPINNFTNKREFYNIQAGTSIADIDTTYDTALGPVSPVSINITNAGLVETYIFENDVLSLDQFPVLSTDAVVDNTHYSERASGFEVEITGRIISPEDNIIVYSDNSINVTIMGIEE